MPSYLASEASPQTDKFLLLELVPNLTVNIFVLWKCHDCGKVFDFPTIIWITALQLSTFPQELYYY